MKEKDVRKKYQMNIEKIDNMNADLDRIYSDYHKAIDKFIEYMNKLEGELPYLPDEEYELRIRDLFGRVKDVYKTMDIFNKEILENKKHLNNIDLSLRIIFDSVEELGDIRNMQKTVKEYEKDAPFIKELKEYTEKLEKREKTTEEYKGTEYA